MILDVNEIQKLLPHRYPFLMIDGILEMERLKSIVGVKNVTINEHFFQGHFPGKPIMPGVLIIEAMAQTGGCCCCWRFRSGRASFCILWRWIRRDSGGRWCLAIS